MIDGVTHSELHRCWLKPDDMLVIAGQNLLGDNKSERSLALYRKNATWSDRGYLPSEKSGPGRTAYRLYSLASSVISRALEEMTAGGGSLECGREIAAATVEMLDARLKESTHFREMDDVIIYSINHDGRFRLQPMDRDEAARQVLGQMTAINTGWFEAGYLLTNIFDAYVQWRNTLVRYKDKRALELVRSLGWTDKDIGILQGKVRYLGYSLQIDNEGWPSDPRHPANRTGGSDG